MEQKIVTIIGGGLAGSEAAWQLAEMGIQVCIKDMKPNKSSPAHKSKYLAELVCSNSLRSDDYEHNAVGLLHQELRLANSLIMQCADATKVPAGGALAVDREGFAKLVSEKLQNHPNIKIISEEQTSLPCDGINIIATGPLTSDDLANAILNEVKSQTLSFYDAIAPVVYKDSIDFSKAWYQSRYDKGDKFDYINCPLSKEEYENFVSELLKAEHVDFHDFEKPQFFDGCLPIEVMAERGKDTLVFGPMKPVGLTNPHSTEKPYAVVQLRQDNAEDTLRNMVGFQTKLKYSEEKRIFRMIPGLENAEFARLGGIHKNTFINSPILLDDFLRLKTKQNIYFAGQITGCEGYVESTAIGFLAGYFVACEVLGKDVLLPPFTTAFGAMYGHLRDNINDDYQPMNINFGLFPPVPPQKTPNGKLRHLKGNDKKEAYCRRALQDVKIWLENIK